MVERILRDPSCVDGSYKSILSSVSIWAFIVASFTANLPWLMVLFNIFLGINIFMAAVVALMWAINNRLDLPLPTTMAVRVTPALMMVSTIILTATIWYLSGSWIITIPYLISSAILSINIELLIQERDKKYTKKRFHINELRRLDKKWSRAMKAGDKYTYKGWDTNMDIDDDKKNK